MTTWGMGITAELIKRCQDQDTEAQMLLYRLCYTHLIGICYRYSNADEDAGALYNRAFFKVLKGVHRHGFNSEEQFMFWARRVMINDLIDGYRRNKSYRTHIVQTDFSSQHSDNGIASLNEAELELDAEYILELIAELPDVQRQVFNLYVIDAYSHKEIGKMLDMSEGTSKWYLSEARKALRKKLAGVYRFTPKTSKL